MKKILLFFVLTLICCVVNAADIKIEKGKANYLKKEGTMNLIINWDNAKYGDEKVFKDHCGDQYNTYKEKGYDAFVAGFNEASKNVKITKEATSADYTMTIIVSNVDYFFSVMSLVPGHKHKIWAEIEVKDVKGNIVCQYKITEYKGGRDFSVIDSFTEMMNDLGKDLAKKK